MNSPQQNAVTFSFTTKGLTTLFPVTTEFRLDVEQRGCRTEVCTVLYCFSCHHLPTHTHTHSPRPVAQRGTDKSNSEKRGFNFGHLCMRGRKTHFLCSWLLYSNREFVHLFVKAGGAASWKWCHFIKCHKFLLFSTCAVWKFQGNWCSYLFSCSFTCSVAACDRVKRSDAHLKLPHF